MSLNTAYATAEHPAVQGRFESAFNANSGTAIEIVRPSASDGWSKWKASYNNEQGNRIHLNFGMLDNELQQSIIDAVRVIATDTVPNMVKAMPSDDHALTVAVNFWHFYV